MTIRLFFCENIFVTDPGQTEGYWICYINSKWDIGPHVEMKINRKNWLVAVDESTIPSEMLTDNKIIEINLNPDRLLTQKEKNIFSNSLDIDITGLNTVRDFLQTKLIRDFPFFDFNVLQLKISQGIYFYIDIVNEHMTKIF